MNRLFVCLVACVGSVASAWAAAPPEAAVQGLYEGVSKNIKGQQKLEARVVALGRGTYKVFIRQFGGEGKVVKVELDGKADGNVVRFKGTAGGAGWNASYADGGAILGTGGQGATLELKRREAQPPTLGAKPPEGAIVLLDGKNFAQLTKRPPRSGTEEPWKLVDGGGIEVPKGGMNSKRQFDGHLKLHVEFRLPLMPAASGQGRANSGVYLPNGDEIQVLDSFGTTTYKGGGCGGLYAYKDPDAFDQFSLASLPPLEWQTFNVEYRVEKKDGKPAGKPRVTVYHNGVKIHDNAELNAQGPRRRTALPGPRQPGAVPQHLGRAAGGKIET